jgi:hypothetical protein
VAPHGHPLLDLVQRDALADEPARLATRARLRTLVHEHGVTVLSAHDPWEPARHAGIRS